MNEYMKAAIEEAEKGIHAGEGGPFGCVIVKDGAPPPPPPRNRRPAGPPRGGGTGDPCRRGRSLWLWDRQGRRDRRKRTQRGREAQGPHLPRRDHGDP